MPAGSVWTASLDLEDSRKAQDRLQIQRILEVKLFLQLAGSFQIPLQKTGVDFECGGSGILDGHTDIHAAPVKRAANQLLNFPFQELIFPRKSGRENPESDD